MKGGSLQLRGKRQLLIGDWRPTELAADDLKTYELVFARTVKDYLPCTAVSFLAKQPAAENRKDGDQAETIPKSWEIGASMVIRHLRPVADAERSRLYLPVWNGQTLLGIAIIESGEQPLFEASINWLLDRSRLISREFLKIKQWSLDPVSGLLNAGYFLEELNVLIEEKQKLSGHKTENGGAHQEDVMLSPYLSLAFLEIYPQRAKSGAQAVHAVVQAAGCLEAMVGGHLPLHHIGYGCFALILNGLSVEQSLKMGKTLLKKLRQESFLNARLGLNTLDLGRIPLEGECSAVAARLIDQAMLALEEAAKRGASALFNWATLEDSPLFALKPPSSRVVREFGRLAKGSALFSVVLLQGIEARPKELASRRFSSLLGAHPCISFGEESVFVFLDGMNGKQANKWLRQLRQKLAAGKESSELPMADFLAGIASFPCLDYSRPQILVNARKSLMHARFLGPASEAFFDDVTLNISGDVYYNEGDLATAIKEYRKGLQLNPESINLLNSLAVCEAQMNRQSRAMASFRKVLELDSKNFMALYNLGFACLQSGELECARANFEQALGQERDNIELALQLAGLYNRSKHFSKAIKLLAPFVENLPQQPDGGGAKPGNDREQAKLNRMLAEAYAGQGKRQQAIVCLQRAIRYDPNDAAALSLLGFLYAEEGQGDEIALSLCRKAVDLDGTRWRFWYRLGSLLQRQGALPEAETVLKTCLSLQASEPETLNLLALVYEQRGKSGMANKTRARVRK